jgi:hypothetical protein
LIGAKDRLVFRCLVGVQTSHVGAIVCLYLRIRLEDGNIVFFFEKSMLLKVRRDSNMAQNSPRHGFTMVQDGHDGPNTAPN